MGVSAIFSSAEFSSRLYSDIRIPEREVETRRDFRIERVFTIDPASAEDLDDALSIKDNGDGTFDVGVHIADVSFFVKPNTPLDRDARKRATSVYLVQRVVPMLPPTLSEELCSLVPGEDRLTFSVVFTMTEDARVIKKWFGRSIIKCVVFIGRLKWNLYPNIVDRRSAARLSYGDAQDVIDGKPIDGVQVLEGHDVPSIESDIRTLHVSESIPVYRLLSDCWSV